MCVIRLPVSIISLALLMSAAAPEAVSPLVAQQVTTSQSTRSQPRSAPVALFSFDGTWDAVADASEGGEPSFVDGLDGQALSLRSDGSSFLTIDPDNLPLDNARDFSVQFWTRTDMDSGQQFVLLSHKEFVSNSLPSQKRPGWAFYVSGGTWAWTIGSGTRRITYERDNGRHMPLTDGRWHQLTMTYSGDRGEIRLFYDGENKAIYHVSDSDGFDFANSSPLVVGWDRARIDPQAEILPAIVDGAEQLQDLVDAFRALALAELVSDELVDLIVDPRGLFEKKVNEMAALRGADSVTFRKAMESVNWEPVADAERTLMDNPYTVHQNLHFTGIAPVTRVYALIDGKITIQHEAAELFAERERLYAPDFAMDNLAVWDRVLSHEEVASSYSEFFDWAPDALEEERSSITSAAWNIWHGGKHFTIEEHGWDSRIAIAETLRAANVDVIMMQETYSSGDFIAAELGYYFATTVDWDYLNQGTNISVLSRFPIEEVHVQEDSPFQNVGVKVAISASQDLYVMSNWYGMDQFPAVFDFHQTRFQESDLIPTLFAGDFNAVPHTDGGDSPASRALLEAGFTDAYRSLYPDVQEHPGPSHRSGRRIDQLYYKGAGLKNTSTEVISTRSGGFPSDHFLILSTFDLDYSTRGLLTARPNPRK